MISPAFSYALPIVVDVEGGSAISLDPDDPGNWTGGEVGAGVLRGTKYGISAAAFPALYIPSLTLDAASRIYFTCYWMRVHADLLQESAALLVFDSAVNQGVGAAIRLLQAALNLRADGVIGPVTLRAMKAAKTDSLVIEMAARRALLYAVTRGFDRNGLGWMRRLASVAFRAAYERPTLH